MSTILEALKKSEQERKQKSVPKLTDRAPPQESSSWPWILIPVVLVCISIALFYVFTQLPTSDNNEVKTNSQSSAANNDAVSSDADTTEKIDATVEVITWSAEVDKRFTIIDGKMMRVGDYLSAGIIIEEINEDSVVFNHRGVRKELKP